MDAVVLEPTATAQAVPATPRAFAGERIAGYDVARSMALLGMFVGHFAAGFTYDATRPAWLATFVDCYLSGRQTATFFVLVGIGVTLLSRRSVAGGDPQAIAKARKTLVCRGLFLLALGYLTFILVQWDILRVYGVSLLMASCLITAPSRRLLFGALAFVVGFVALFLAFDFYQNWDRANNWVYTGPWTPSGLIRNLFFDGFRSVFPWAGFVLFGMWLGRQDLRRVALNNLFLACAVAILVVVEAGSALALAYFPEQPGGTNTEMTRAFLGTLSMPALPLFMLAGGSLAVTVIALSVRLVEAWPGRHWQPLVATGQLALTWWITHIVFLIIAMPHRLLPIVSLRSAAAYGVVFFVVAVLISWLWKMAFRNGPLEWVMRRVAG
jgi:uncharacterized membrane protein YeiB